MITVCIVKGHFIVHGCMDECLIIFLIRTQKKATLQKQKKKMSAKLRSGSSGSRAYFILL